MRVSRTLLPALLVVAGLPAFSQAVVGAPSASATALASAKIYQPISSKKAGERTHVVYPVLSAAG